MSIKYATIATAFTILLVYGLLVCGAFYFFEPAEFTKAVSSARVLHALSVSVSAATLAAFFALIVGVPAAYALSRYQFKFKSLVNVMLELPMVVSPAALGALILIFLQTPPGVFMRNNGMDVVYVYAGIVVAQFVTVLGVSVRMIKSVFDEIPLRFEHIARTLGATPWRAFIDVVLPLGKRGIISAFVLTWAKAIGEFGATITVAGSMAMKTETLPTAIFMSLSMANVKGTVVLIMLLLGISLILLLVVQQFSGDLRENDGRV